MPRSFAILPRPPLRLLALAAVAAVPAAIQAQDGSWKGGDYDLWSADNWYQHQRPGQRADTNIYFEHRDTNHIVQNDLAQNFLLRSIRFSGREWNLNGYSLRFADKGHIDVIGDANRTTVNVAMSLDGAFDARVVAGSQLTLAGAISGKGTLTKTGAGICVLTGLHTNTSGIVLNEGTLIDYHPIARYEPRAGSVLEFALSSNTTYDGIIAGAGAFVKSGAGSLTFTGSQFYTGGTTVKEGTLVERYLHDAYTVAANAELDFTYDYSHSFSGGISGAGRFVKNGRGFLTLDTAGGFTGALTVDVEHGGLETTASDVLSASTALVVGNDGTYVMMPGRNLKQTIASLSGAGSVGLWGALTVGGSATTTYSGLIDGYGRLILDGTGTLTLTGANDYTGGTTVNGGRLIDANPHGDYATNGTGVLEFAKAGDYGYAGSVGGSGSFVKSGSGNLTLSGLLGAATTTVSGGTITLGGSGRLASDTALTLASNTALILGDRDQTVASLGGGGSVKLGSGDLTVGTGDYAGEISGTGKLVKVGAGTLTLERESAYTGGTDIQAGLLVDPKLHGDYAIAGSGSLKAVGQGTFSGVVSGAGSFVKAGNGALTLAGANTYAGGTTVGGGRLTDRNPHGSYGLQGGSILDLSPVTGVSSGIAVTGAGTFVKSGSGTVVLASAIGSGVTVRLSGGVLKGSADQIGDVVSDGGTLQLDQSARSGNYVGAFSGSGALLKTGSRGLTLANLPTNTGGIRVSGGSLGVSGPGALRGGLTVDPGASFFNFAGDAVTIGGRSANQGEVATLSGSTTAFTGLVSGAGRFTGLGGVEFDGGYSPGNSTAAVRFDGDLKLGSANALTMELGGTALGAGYDHLTVDGTAFLGGTLNVAWSGGFAAGAGQSFDLFDFAHWGGTFASINLPTLSNGLVWNTSNLYTTGVLRTQAVPEPASLAALGLGGLALLRRRRRA